MCCLIYKNEIRLWLCDNAYDGDYNESNNNNVNCNNAYDKMKWGKKKKSHTHYFL